MIGRTPRPFIFVHIPKCAGTSIEQALIPIVCGRVGFGDLSKDERSRFWLPGDENLQHAKIEKIEREYKLDEFFKFAFVRNPWDRAVSQIGYLSSRPGLSVFPKLDFKEQVRIYCHMKRMIWGQDLGACQVDYLRSISGDVRMDFIGRFESLPNDFARACGMMGLADAPVLPHVFNSKRTRHYSSYYDAESAGWIRDRFAKDIEFFCYEFENISTDSESATDGRQ